MSRQLQLSALSPQGQSLIILSEVQTPSSRSLCSLFCFSQKLWGSKCPTYPLEPLLAAGLKEAVRGAQPGRHISAVSASPSQEWHDRVTANPAVQGAEAEKGSSVLTAPLGSAIPLRAQSIHPWEVTPLSPGQSLCMCSLPHPCSVSSYHEYSVMEHPWFW